MCSYLLFSMLILVQYVVYRCEGFFSTPLALPKDGDLESSSETSRTLYRLTRR
jgi:hypothetical protein